MALKQVRPNRDYGIEYIAHWLENSEEFGRVLDVGGAQRPLRCATHVIDLLPYERRQIRECWGALSERFSEETWLCLDVNDLPWPFEDNSFDYVWCSQVVEDIRDPIGVCREMQRIASQGFISTVQRQYESSVVQDGGVVGYHHHRWLIEADLEASEIVFTFKSPLLQTVPELRAPVDRTNYLLHLEWERPFGAREVFLPEGWMQQEELEKYLRERRWEQ